jgi:acyl-[acyl-carrier-protein]-phospholipid O-acyltransferase/long-chain-fatty-acid--[acyl-carrier-protein] ligase
MATRIPAGSSLLRDVVRACRKRRTTVKLSDSTGAELSGGRTLTSALALRTALHKILGGEPRVAVLLPPSTAAAVTNLALAFDGRVTIGLNYTLTAEILNGCLAQAGVRHVITSRRFLERVPIALDTKFIFLEDVRAQLSIRDKASAALLATLAPSGLLARALGRREVAAADPMMIVFTSGTTGEPKGAELTYGNVSASIDAVSLAMRLDEHDVLIGVLPFFHGFGAILTLWTALSLDIAAAYHVNPLDVRGVGELCRTRQGTILPATPTFLRAYCRRGAPEDFASLEAIVTGGEPLSHELADAVEAAFGVRPVEGYGATEAASLISANIPAHRMPAGDAAICRERTVGRPLPGIHAKVIDVDSGAELGRGRQGLLWVRGPNVMAGYLGRPEETAEVLRDGWYATGDIAIMHEDGCIEIVGRRSRFAKVGGEMVPLSRIEDALTAHLGDSGDDDGPPLAVIAVPDEIRGERLIVLHQRLERSPIELRRDLIASGLPPIFVPAAADFVRLDRLPMTATGKLDFGRLGEIAAAAGAARRSPSAFRKGVGQGTPT